MPNRYEDYPRVSDADIDPSFPDELKEYHLVREDLLGNREVAVGQWVAQGGSPNLDPYLVVEELCGEVGPWILLDGYVNQEDADSKRSRFAFLRGILVKDEDADNIAQALTERRLGKSRPPEVPDDHYTYAGEVPWCDTYPENDHDALSSLTGTKSITEIQEKPVVLRGGEPLTEQEERDFWLSIGEPLMPTILISRDEDALEEVLRDRGLELSVETKQVEREVEEQEEFWALVPVRNNAWEDYHSSIISGRSVSTPAKQLAKHLGLVNQPQTFDQYEKNGRLASVTFGYGERWHDREHFTYLRKDLVDRYLSDTSTRLVHIIWGERQFYSEDFGERESYAKNNPPYEAFEYVLLYEPN